MWLPKKSSSKFGMVIGIALSLGSFVAIHAGFLWLHEFVNEATPDSAVAYAFDRGLEHTERWIARAKGSASTIETYADHAAERMDELEHLLTGHGAAGAHVDELERLLVDTRFAMEKSVGYLESYAKGKSDDLKMFTLALFVESTVGDISRRLEKAEALVEESQKPPVAEALPAMVVLVRRSQEVTAAFAVEPEVAAVIRADVQTQMVTRRPPPVIRAQQVSSQNFPTLCASRNASCATTADCCEGQDLFCTQVFLANGSRAKRCMRQ